MRIKAKLGGTSKYIGENSIGGKIVLPISLNSTALEGEKLGAVFSVIENRFSHCDIIIADTLQRFNCHHENADVETCTDCRLSGEQWVNDNKYYLKMLQTPHKIIQWDECRYSSSFASWRQKIRSTYAATLEYQMAFEADIKKYTNRFVKNNPSAKLLQNQISKNSLNYLIEESAVIMSYFVGKQYNYILYPSKIPNSVAYTRKLFVEKTRPDLIRDIKVYFKYSNVVENES